MKDEAAIHFPPFRLELANEQLWRETELLRLRPKPFALLRYLALHPGRLVTKEELLKAVWPDVRVSEGLLHTYVRDLRRVLGETREASRLIETVARRGYRFIGKVVSSQEEERQRAGSREQGAKISNFSPTPNPQPLPPSLVGRDSELAELHERLAKALRGERQVVFVTGEPGIGKTALIEAFVSDIQTQEESKKSKIATSSPAPNTQHLAPVFVAHGQCIEHYGPGEAYLPVLEALERLYREPGCEHIPTLLRRYAPMWLVQMPSLLEPGEQAELLRQLVGTTRERMLREAAVLLETLTAERVLVLVLEDLHWADTSTVELLAYLARRPDAARLLIIGTYRPEEVFTTEHALAGAVRELQVHRQCHELILPTLPPLAVNAYLEKRFPHSLLPTRFAQALYAQTGGNPLFLVAVVSDLIARNVLMAVDGSWSLQVAVEAVSAIIPDNLRLFITKRIEHLTSLEQEIVEAGSVVGAVFSTAAVAAAMEVEVPHVEACCEQLVRHYQFLHRAGIEEWPDGTVTSRYTFHHALYQYLCHERVTPTRRQQWHRRIGERLAVAYGERSGEVAAELAVHFAEGRDIQRAIRYHTQAAGTAMRLCAYQEAILHLTQGLKLLPLLPNTPERARFELPLYLTLGAALSASKGYSAPEVGETYARALELSQQIEDLPRRLQVLLGLEAFYFMRGDLRTAQQLGEQCLSLAQDTRDSSHLLQASWSLGLTLYQTGEFIRAQEYMKQSIALYDPRRHHSPRALQDPGVMSLCYEALILWYLGYLEQSLQRTQQALTLARELSHHFSTAFALITTATIHLLRGEQQAAQEGTETALSLSSERGFPLWSAYGKVLHGWLLVTQGEKKDGIALIRQGITTWAATGAGITTLYLLAVLAEALGAAEETEEGRKILGEAFFLAHKHGEHFYEAELYRLKGELLLSQEIKNQKSKVKSQKSKVKSQKSKIRESKS